MHAHLKEVQDIRGTAAEHQAKAKDSIGDIIVYLADYCNARGWNLEEIVREVWPKVRKRDWAAERAVRAAQAFWDQT
jgi:NTP pyrophosphatase (non-canonical NTP hydrolase)